MWKSYFFHVCWYSQWVAYTSLAFGTTQSDWWMNSKAFRILSKSCLSELSWNMVAKTLKNPYHWQTMRFKLFQKGKKTNTLKEKPKVVYSVALVLSFLLAKNENWQVEDLPLANFGHLPERLLLFVRTKSINENFVNWKLGPLLFGNHDSMHFSVLRVSANTLYNCYSGIVDSFIFTNLRSWLFFPVKGYCVCMINKIIHGCL